MAEFMTDTTEKVLIFSTDSTTDLNLMGGDGKAGTVSLSELENNIAEMSPAINGVVEKLKATAAATGLTEVSLAIGINAKGKVGFLGTGAEMGGNATITLKFKVG